MEKNHSDNPPPYSEIMYAGTNAPIVPIAAGPNSAGLYEQSYAVPSHTFQPAAAYVITQPIATAPPTNYGTMYGPPPPPPKEQSPPQPQITTQYITVVPTDILRVGGCSVCRIGVLEDNFPCLGIFCAIFFFPVGILCCLALKNKRCSNCGFEF